MSVKFQVLKAEDNYVNSFLVDEEKVGDQVVASLTVDEQEFNGMGDNQDAAIEDLRDKIKSHFFAKNHEAQLEINKAIGLHFFE